MKKIILLAAAVFLFQHFYQGGTPVVQAAEVKHEHVILYATSWCGYCKRTRAFLAENHIQYTEYDIETSLAGSQQYAALGGNGVPVLDIKGNVIHGYSVKKMTNTLQSLGLMQ